MQIAGRTSNECLPVSLSRKKKKRKEKREDEKNNEKTVVSVTRETAIFEPYTTWSLCTIESAEREFRLHISLFSTAVLPPIDTRIPPFSPPPPPELFAVVAPPKLAHSKTHSKRAGLRFARRGPGRCPIAIHLREHRILDTLQVNCKRESARALPGLTDPGDFNAVELSSPSQP